jgi:hypothetical protein
MLGYILIIIITNIGWLFLIKNFPDIIFKLCKEILGNDKLYIKKSILNREKIGLYSNIKIERGIEIIKYLDKGNHVTYFGNFINESKNKMVTNCYLRKKDDGYYLLSNREIMCNEELIIQLN